MSLHTGFLIVHVAAGSAGLLLGPVAMLVPKRPGWHPRLRRRGGSALPRARSRRDDVPLASAGRLDQAWLVERGTMPDQRVVRLKDADPADCPYFPIVLVHGSGRRQETVE